ncbi:hypothetical protein TcCL_Unassigned05427 [Trypanosoma cruzi]|nr:hypothetical protein TcCL_Unassigned05427 [Trypanosoma cruzi]
MPPVTMYKIGKELFSTRPFLKHAARARIPSSYHQDKFHKTTFQIDGTQCKFPESSAKYGSIAFLLLVHRVFFQINSITHTPATVFEHVRPAEWKRKRRSRPRRGRETHTIRHATELARWNDDSPLPRINATRSYTIKGLLLSSTTSLFHFHFCRGGNYTLMAINSKAKADSTQNNGATLFQVLG